MRKSKFVKRIIIYLLLVLAAFLLETCVFPMITVLSAAPNLMLIITFSYGFIYGSTSGIICGVFAGFLMDIFYLKPLGMFMLVFSCIGYFCGIFSDQLENDQLVFPLLLCFLSELFYNAALCLYKFLIIGELDLGYSIIRLMVPEIFFTMIITVAAYRVLLNTNRRMDRLDNVRGRNVA